MEKSVYKKGNKEIIAKAYREQGKLRIVILLQFKSFTEIYIDFFLNDFK